MDPHDLQKKTREQLIAEIQDLQKKTNGAPTKNGERKFLANATVDAVINLDSQHRIIMINKATEYLFGFKKSEILGLPISELIPEKIIDENGDNYINFHLPKEGENIHYNTLARGLSALGDYFRIEISLSEMETDNQKGYILLIRPLHINNGESKKNGEHQLQFEDLFNPLTDVFTRVSKDGYFEMVSNSVKAVLGYDPEELIGKKVENFYVYPNDRKMMLRIIESKGACKNFETLFITKNDENRFISISAKERKNAKGESVGIEGIVRDITPQKKMEDRLLEKTKQFKDLFEYSPDAIFIHNFKEITNVNRAFLRLFKFDHKQDVIGRPPLETTVIPEDYHLVMEARKALKKKASFKIPFIRHKNASGDIFSTETFISSIVIGGIPHLQIVSRDITGRLKLESKFKKSQERLRSINRNSPDFITTIDANLKITYLNRVLEGYKHDELIGATILNFVPKPYQEFYINCLNKAFNGEQQEFEMEGFGKNNDQNWYSVRISPININQDSSHLLIISTDISDRKNTEIRNNIANSISNKLNSNISMPDFCLHIYLKLKNIPAFQDIYMAHYNEEENRISIFFQVQDGVVKTEDLESRIGGNGLFEHIIRNKKGLLLDEKELRTFHKENGLAMYGAHSISWIGVPIISDDKIVGVLAAESFNRSEAYSHKDLNMLSLIGTQIGKLMEREKSMAEIEQFERYFSVSMDLLSIASVKGEFVKINPKFLQVLGYSEEEILNTPFIDFVHPDDVRATLMEVKKLSQGTESVNFMNRYRCKNDEYKWFLWAAAPDTETGLLYCAAKDITEQKKTQEILSALSDVQNSFIGEGSDQESFQKMLDILLNVTQSEYGFIGEVDYRGNQPYLKTHAITDISWDNETSAFYEAHRQNGLEFTNMETLFGQVITEKKAVISNDPENDPRKGGLPEGHTTMRSFMGLPFFNDKKLVGMVGMANKPKGYSQKDIDLLEPFLATCATLIKAYQNAKKTKKIEKEVRKLADIVSYSNDAIISTTRDGIITSWNAGAENLLNYKMDEIIDKHISIFGPRSLSKMQTATLREAQSGTSIEGYETKLLKRNGDLVDVSMSIFPLIDENGKVKGMSSIVRDISTKKEADRIKEEFTKELEIKVNERTIELKDAQKQLAMSLEKEKELGELKSRFVATASHQFRTPLTVIQSSIGVLAMQMEMDNISEEFRGKFDRVYQRITGQVKRMTELMNDVLIIGKINSGRIKPTFRQVDIKRLCEKICTNYNDIQEDQRKIQLDIHGKPRKLNLDHKLMEHAISNLVSNAFKYSQNKPSPILSITFGPAKVSLMVKDFGNGIPDKDLQYLFEPFYRASNVDEILGTGLGLSIAKEYVELNKGEISLESKLHKGTEFNIIFKQ